MKEYRRIIVGGEAVEVTVEPEGDLLCADGRRFDPSEVVYLAPVQPTKIICVHLNYEARVNELGFPQDVAPTYFQKPVSCLNSHRGQVVRPAGCHFLNYEGEIAIVIGRTARNIRLAESGDYILGYSIANDFGLHDFREADRSSLLRVKGSDSLGPVGPGLTIGWDFRSKSIRTLVNGVVKQEAMTDDMIWNMHYLVADLARNLTLVPGDVILSGTPAHSRPVQPGDVVTVEVEGLGSLTNTIVEGPAPVADGIGAQPHDSESVRRVALGEAGKSGQ